VDAAGPAVLGVDELLADQARYVPEARCDGAVMRRAGGQVDMRRKLVQDDRGNHRTVLLGGAADGGGTWPLVHPGISRAGRTWMALPAAGASGAAAKLPQDAPGLELGVGAFTGGAQQPRARDGAEVPRRQHRHSVRSGEITI